MPLLAPVIMQAGRSPGVPAAARTTMLQAMRLRSGARAIRARSLQRCCALARAVPEEWPQCGCMVLDVDRNSCEGSLKKCRLA